MVILFPSRSGPRASWCSLRLHLPALRRPGGFLVRSCESKPAHAHAYEHRPAAAGRPPLFGGGEVCAHRMGTRSCGWLRRTVLRHTSGPVRVAVVAACVIGGGLSGCVRALAIRWRVCASSGRRPPPGACSGCCGGRFWSGVGGSRSGSLRPGRVSEGAFRPWLLSTREPGIILLDFIILIWFEKVILIYFIRDSVG